MCRSEDIHVRERSSDAPCNGLIVFQSQQRIQPYDFLHASPGSSQLRSQQLRFSGIPTVTQDEKDRIAREHLPPVELFELSDRLAPPCTPPPPPCAPPDP